MPKARTNGIDIDYAVEGEGEPLVMIMGLGGPRGSFKHQTRAFKKHYRTVTFDNRGVGKSDKPKGPYSIRMMAEDTLGLMDHLSIQSAHVLGVSMGGMIAQELTINHPERVAKLALGCTFATAGSGSSSSETNRAAEARAESSQDETSQRKLISDTLDLSFTSWSNRTILRRVAKVAIRFYPIGGMIEQIKAVSTFDSAERPRKIHAPTLVIPGTDDRLIDPTSSETVTKLVPNARLVKVPGGGHYFFMEKHDGFNREVLLFLGEAE